MLNDTHILQALLLSTKLLNRSSVPAKISVKRYFTMLISSLVVVVVVGKFCHSMQVDV